MKTKDIVKLLENKYCCPLGAVKFGRLKRNKKFVVNNRWDRIPCRYMLKIDEKFYTKVIQNWDCKNKSNRSHAVSLVANNPETSRDFFVGLEIVRNFEN